MADKKEGHRIMYELLTKLGCAILGGAIVAYYRDLLSIFGPITLFIILLVLAGTLIVSGLCFEKNYLKTSQQ